MKRNVKIVITRGVVLLVKGILFIFFYLILTPVGLIMRLLSVDHLDRRIEKQKYSYWQNKY